MNVFKFLKLHLFYSRIQSLNSLSDSLHIQVSVYSRQQTSPSPPEYFQEPIIRGRSEFFINFRTRQVKSLRKSACQFFLISIYIYYFGGILVIAFSTFFNPKGTNFIVPFTLIASFLYRSYTFVLLRIRSARVSFLRYRLKKTQQNATIYLGVFFSFIKRGVPSTKASWQQVLPE